MWERRERVDRAPIEVAALARDAIAAGVTPGDLRAALEDGLPEEPQAPVEEPPPVAEEPPSDEGATP